MWYRHEVILGPGKNGPETYCEGMRYEQRVRVKDMCVFINDEISWLTLK